MRGSVKRVLLWLGVPLLLVALGFAIFVRWATPPSPEALKEQFRSKRASLEALIQLMNEDGLDGFCLRGRGLEGMQRRLEPERFEEYRTRMQEAEVGCVDRRDQRIEISVWGFGMPGTDRSRGFVWSRETLPNEFACLDSSCFPPDFLPKRWERVHERLDPEWVIFAF